jgi:hypothetical protein
MPPVKTREQDLTELIRVATERNKSYDGNLKLKNDEQIVGWKKELKLLQERREQNEKK